jgi:hypothetical protein
MPAVPPAPEIILDLAPADRPAGERINTQSRPTPIVVVAKPEPHIEPEPIVLSPWAA